MLFDSTFRKEVARNFNATLIVLVTIVLTVMLVRTLGRASAGRVNPSEVVLVLGYTMIGYLPIILTLSLFVAATATLTRMYSESEMVVWFTCGRSLFSFVRPLLRLSWPVLLAIALLSLFAWPWSNQQISELQNRYQGRGDIERVAPGRFIESAGGKRVFFIDKNSPDGKRGSGIFINTRDHNKESFVTAESGYVQGSGTGRTLVLENGWRIQRNTRTGTSSATRFKEYENQIAPETAINNEGERPRLVASAALMRAPSPSNAAELSWRLGLVFIAFNCLFIALASARGNPRVGRSAGLVWALVTFAVYYNLIGMGQSWIGRGRVGALAFMLILHGGIFLAALAWLRWRERSWRRGRPVAAGAAA